MFGNRPRFLVSFLTLSVSAVLSGCGMHSLTSTGSNGVVSQSAPTVSFTGKIHGGEQPVTGSTVNLYAAGSSGYGSAATLLATTTSDATGSFQFTNGTAGNGTTNKYICPTITSSSGAVVSPQIYVTSIGGVTDGSGNAAHTNTAAVLTAAIGPCSALTSATPVYINELTTVAAATSLGQYISAGTTAGTFSIGSPNTTQGLQGISNAYLQMLNLVSTAGGSSSGQITSRSYTGSQDLTRSTVVGVTVTATPESTKLNTFADIIAACVNNTSNTGTGCAMLFSAATPPTASLTSHPTVVSPAVPVDTMMAAYYMATNPAQTTATTCNGTVTSETGLACEYSLFTAQSPFQPVLTAAPTDWSIGVTFASAGQCNAVNDATLTSTGYFFNGPVEQAVDKFGNVWIANGNRFAQGSNAAPYVPATISAISPYGQPLACPMSSVTSAGTGTAIAQGARGVTIDPSGNIWGSFLTFANTGIQEFVAPTNFVDSNGVPGITGTLSTTIPAPVAISATYPYISAPYILSSDLSGNIFYASPNTNTTTVVGTYAGGENLFELPVGGTSWVPAATNQAQVTTATAGTATSANNPLQMLPDSKGRIWIAESGNVSGPVAYYPTGSTTYGYYQAPESGSTALGDYGLAISNAIPVTGFTSGNAATAADVVWFGTTCCSTPSKTANTYYRSVIKDTPATYTQFSAPTYTATPGQAQTGFATGASSAGQNGVRAIAVDGAGTTYIGSEYSMANQAVDTPNSYGITLYRADMLPIGNIGAPPTAATYCSTTVGCGTGGGYQKADFQKSRSFVFDNSGTLWVGNLFYAAVSGSNSTYTGATVTQVVGLGVPIGSPASATAATGTIGVAP